MHHCESAEVKGKRATRDLDCLFSRIGSSFFSSKDEWVVADDVFLSYFSSCGRDTALFCPTEGFGVAGQVAGFSVPSVSWPC